MTEDKDTQRNLRDAMRIVGDLSISLGRPPRVREELGSGIVRLQVYEDPFNFLSYNPLLKFQFSEITPEGQKPCGSINDLSIIALQGETKTPVKSSRINPLGEAQAILPSGDYSFALCNYPRSIQRLVEGRGLSGTGINGLLGSIAWQYEQIVPNPTELMQFLGSVCNQARRFKKPLRFLIEFDKKSEELLRNQRRLEKVSTNDFLNYVVNHLPLDEDAVSAPSRDYSMSVTKPRDHPWKWGKIGGGSPYSRKDDGDDNAIKALEEAQPYIVR